MITFSSFRGWLAYAVFVALAACGLYGLANSIFGFWPAVVSAVIFGGFMLIQGALHL
jgi:hypothetical protein